MTEKDLALKAAMRRLMWRMGMSTRIDVPLRAYVPEPTSRTRAGIESYTDLDVLGVFVGRDARIQTAIGDCKTSPRGSTERMFWIRGIADFFSADDAYMVRSNEVTAAARQLAVRLGIAVLTAQDLATLETYHTTHLDLESEALGLLFAPDRIANYRRAMTEIDARLRPLVEFKEFDYWVYEDHRNLLQVVAHLQDGSKLLNPDHPVHVALFYECCWLYCLSLSRAVQYVRRMHVSDIDASLREFLFGGQLGLREKQTLARVLTEAAGKSPAKTDDAVFPPYFNALLELVTRAVRRPGKPVSALRYAEWLAEAHFSKMVQPLRLVFGEAYDELAAKLLGDIASFLVTAAKLDPRFRDRAREVLLLASLPSASDRGGRERTAGVVATRIDGPAPIQASPEPGHARASATASTAEPVEPPPSGKVGQMAIPSATDLPNDRPTPEQLPSNPPSDAADRNDPRAGKLADPDQPPLL